MQKVVSQQPCIQVGTMTYSVQSNPVEISYTYLVLVFSFLIISIEVLFQAQNVFFAKNRSSNIYAEYPMAKTPHTG